MRLQRQALKRFTAPVGTVSEADCEHGAALCKAEAADAGRNRANDSQSDDSSGGTVLGCTFEDFEDVQKSEARIDPFRALADFALGRLKQSLIGQWFRFLFALGFSGTLSFLFICGVSLTSGESASISIGRGMVAAAVCMTVCYRKYKSKLLAGLPIVLPEAEAEVELKTDIQTIERT